MKQILKKEEEEEEDDCSVPATGKINKKSPKLAIPKKFCECGRRRRGEEILKTRRTYNTHSAATTPSPQKLRQIAASAAAAAGTTAILKTTTKPALHMDEWMKERMDAQPGIFATHGWKRGESLSKWEESHFGLAHCHFFFGDEFSPFCGKYLCKILFTQNSLFKKKFAKNN